MSWKNISNTPEVKRAINIISAALEVNDVDKFVGAMAMKSLLLALEKEGIACRTTKELIDEEIAKNERN